jgi:Ferredoxin-like domain in Api92-like protein
MSRTCFLQVPNHVYNRLRVQGHPVVLEALVAALRCGEPDPRTGRLSPLDFERHVPMPPRLAAVLLDANPLQADVRAVRDWRRRHWGTKWNAQVDEMVADLSGGEVTYRFTTAWRPPDAWLGVVAALHPALVFVHEYYEEYAHFAGRATLIDGRLTATDALDPYELAWAEWSDEGVGESV